jgi:PAS domain S-box-containing protein
MSAGDPDAIRVLHVDDEPNAADLAATVLEREREDLEVSTATSASEGLDRLAESTAATGVAIDCIVSDYDMPGMDGLEFLEAVREEHPNVPFVLFTGRGSEEIASEAIGAGVTEYLPKGTDSSQYELLAHRITNAVETRRAERRSAEQARVSTVVREITQSVVRAATREGIEQAVCDRFVDTEPYRFAWIGEPDDETSEIVPQAHAGAGEGYLDEITVTTDDAATGKGPGGRTARTHEVAVTADIRTDSAFEPWREAAERRGYRSSAAVPIVHEGTLYAVLMVYADRPGAFDATERTMLAELGETIGHAIHAVETRGRLREQYRELFEQAPVMYAITGNEGDEPIVEDCNERFCETLGYSREAVVGQPLAEFYTDESAADLLDGGYERALAAEFVSEEREFVARDGSVVETLLRAVPRVNEAGAVVGTLTLFVDITERKRAEEVLEQAQAMETAMDGMALLDADGKYVYANDAHAAIYGYDDPGAFVGESWRLCYADEEVARFEAHVLDALEADGAWRGEATGKRRDGSSFPQDVSLTALEDGGTVCVVRDITGRKTRERELQRRNDRLRTIVENVPLVLFAFDAEGTFTLSEGRGLEQLDLEPGEVVGESVFDVYAGTSLVEGARRAIDGEAIHTTVEIDERFFETWLHPVADDGNGGTQTIGVAVDVTERRERERERERYRTVIETVDDAVYVLDDEGRFEFVNEAFSALTGYDASAVLGESVELIEDEATSRRFEVLVEEMVSTDTTETTVEYEIETASGEWIPCEDHIGLRLDDGAFQGITGVLRDTTERERRERTLEALYQRTREMMHAESPADVCETTTETADAVLDHSLTGIWLHDDEGPALRPVACSERVDEVFDDLPTYTPDSPGLSWDVFESGTGRVYDDLAAEPTINPETPARSEIVLPLGRHGVMNISSITENTFEQSDVALARLLATTVEAALDRAERETVLRDRQRRLEQQNERLDEFADTVSHDLRNPLSVADGRLALLREDVDSEHVEPIDQALDRMDTLIEDALTLAKQGLLVSDPEPVALGTVTEAALSTVGNPPADVALADDLPTVRADRERLQTLLENLLRNAVDHGESDTTVTVGVLDDEGFYVADDGPGIPVAERSDAFEYGFSTDENGTGIGLAIVKNIAEAHGWAISVHEAASGGARFEIRTEPSGEPHWPSPRRSARSPH